MSPQGVTLRGGAGSVSEVVPEGPPADPDPPRLEGAGAEDPPSRSTAREVVHDLRQPLATVAALVCAAEMDPALAPDVRQKLEQIKSELQLMADLCHRLLDEVPRATAAVRLDQLAREAGVSASLAFGRPVEVHATFTEVSGNELDLRRAVQNLLENACRAAGPAGVVRLVVREQSHRVRIEVHDDGPGFGGTHRGKASLGLNIVQLVATQHGGHVEVGESDLGGARLVIVLPSSE